MRCIYTSYCVYLYMYMYIHHRCVFIYVYISYMFIYVYTSYMCINFFGQKQMTPFCWLWKLCTQLTSSEPAGTLNPISEGAQTKMRIRRWGKLRRWPCGCWPRRSGWRALTACPPPSPSCPARTAPPSATTTGTSSTSRLTPCFSFCYSKTNGVKCTQLPREDRVFLCNYYWNKLYLEVLTRVVPLNHIALFAWDDLCFFFLRFSNLILMLSFFVFLFIHFFSFPLL